MNKMLAIGNLTTDVRYNRVVVDGVETPRATFGLAVNMGRGDRQVTDYFTVTCWRGLAENAMTFLKKGRKVAVSGQLHLSNYVAQSGANAGKQVFYLNLQAGELEFLSPREDPAAAPVVTTNTAPAVPAAPEATPAAHAAPAATPVAAAGVILSEEDLPF